LASTTPDVAQPFYLGAPIARDPFRGAEEVGQGPEFVTTGSFRRKVPDRRIAGEVTDRCHFKPRGDWLWTREQVALLQRPQELAQIAIFHTKSYKRRFIGLTRN
jgi:hypothetical protein